MPVGDRQECQLPPPSSEPAAQAEGGGGGGEVEGGRERWEEGKQISGRRKRKVNASTTKCAVQEPPQQVYGINERNWEGAPSHQQQIEQDHHSLSAKRQCLGGYGLEAPSNGDTQGHYDGEGTSVETGVTYTPPDVFPPASEPQPSRSGEGGEGGQGGQGDEDVVCVVRREQIKVRELLTQCGEALSEGMAYEAFFPVRIEEMLRATQSLEQSLLSQKQAMKERLQEIIGIL